MNKLIICSAILMLLASCGQNKEQTEMQINDSTAEVCKFDIDRLEWTRQPKDF